MNPGGSEVTSTVPTGQRPWTPGGARAVIVRAARTEFAGWGFALVFVGGLAAMVMRRIDAVTDPKLWVEDGIIFLPFAYLHDLWSNLTTPYAGGLHASSRLWAQFCTLLPVAWTAGLYAWFALILSTACCAVVMSRRLRWLVPSDAVRAAIFLLLVMLPAQDEIHATLTNNEWFISIAIVLSTLADDPTTPWGRMLEPPLLALAVLSGPQGLVLSPLLVLRWLRTRSAATVRTLALVAVADVLQAQVVLTHTGDSLSTLVSHVDLVGATAVITERVGGVMVYGSHHGHETWAAHGTSNLEYAVSVGMLGLLGVALLRLPRTAGLTLAGALVFSLVATLWKFHFDLSPLRDPGTAQRYFTTATAVIVIACVGGVALGRAWNRPLSIIAVILPLCGIAVATWSDAALQPLPTINWPESARCIASHQACVVPVNPPGFRAYLPPLASAH